jgi:tRNA G26 N,N-dimethylase Trm1
MTSNGVQEIRELSEPLWGDRMRDRRVCSEVVNIITDAKLIRERDLCHFLRTLLRWAKGQQLL